MSGCELCAEASDAAALRTVAATASLRVVRVLDEPAFPAYWRVVWKAHVRELSELSPGERVHCLDAVVAVERAALATLAPDKINLAALGNLVPHLHWHVVARFEWDSHFPAPIWAPARRERTAGRLEALAARLPAADAAIAAALAAI